MFDPASRYEQCEDAVFTKSDGTITKYKKRRIVPSKNDDQSIITELVIKEGERIDLLSSKIFGDPEQYWRLCDMNETMHPVDLTTILGKRILIRND